MRKPLTPLAAERVFLDMAGENAGDAYEWAARAPRTWLQYRSAFGGWAKHRKARGLPPLPAERSGVLEYIDELVEGGRGVASVLTLLSALSVASQLAGHRFDRHLFRGTVKGLKRLHGHNPRRARPLTAAEMKPLLVWLDTDRLMDIRDRALMALGWSMAGRQSELVALDWAQQGKGEGVLVRDQRGLTITLARSKTSQEKPVDIIVPEADMPTACAAIDRWAQAAQLEPGQPIFCRIVGPRLTKLRLAPDAVARIVKQRVFEHSMARGARPAEAIEARASVSGHSLRAGFITQAAMKGTPESVIRRHSRHKSAEQVAAYVRLAEKWHRSAVKGVGF
jgi:integrase